MHGPLLTVTVGKSLHVTGRDPHGNPVSMRAYVISSYRFLRIGQWGTSIKLAGWRIGWAGLARLPGAGGP